MSSDAKIHLDRVAKVYPGSKEPAVEELTLDVPETDLLGLTGMRVPRWETGRRAVHLLARLPQRQSHVLLACEYVEGTTLSAPRANTPERANTPRGAGERLHRGNR